MNFGSILSMAQAGLNGYASGGAGGAGATTNNDAWGSFQKMLEEMRKKRSQQGMDAGRSALAASRSAGPSTGGVK